MKRLFLTLNHMFLFLCVSMYLGTGWSLVLFSFPVGPQLTPSNYHLQFVPQVTAATHFFTYMTGAMVLAAIIMLVSEWKRGLKWVPLVVLAGVVVATLLTTQKILPLNKEMAAGITSQVRLNEILDQWMSLNRVRVGLWTVQWAAMMLYFGRAFFKLKPAGS